MTYQEKEITKKQLEKILQTLDLDEGVRIENKSNMIFINRSAKRYCIYTSTQEGEEFVYYNSVQEVITFLNDKINQTSKIFFY